MSRSRRFLNCLSLGAVALFTGACGDAADLTQSSPVKTAAAMASVTASATGPDYYVLLRQAGATTQILPGDTAHLSPRSIPGGWEVNVQLLLGNVGTTGHVTQYGNLTVMNPNQAVFFCGTTKGVAPPAPFQNVLIGGFRVFYPGGVRPPIAKPYTVYRLHAWISHLNGTPEEDVYLGNNDQVSYILVPAGGSVSCY